MGGGGKKHAYSFQMEFLSTNKDRGSWNFIDLEKISRRELYHSHFKMFLLFSNFMTIFPNFC